MSQATVTAKQGPGNTITSKVIANITGLKHDMVRQVITISAVGVNDQEFDVSGNTTFTLTFASSNYTLTIS